MLQAIRQTIAFIFAPEIFAQNRTLKIERRNALRLARRDDLTGLANRRAFELARGAADKTAKFAFIVFDLNNFKTVNDSYGHSKGDEVLKQFARVLKLNAAEIGFGERVFRLGGDEFTAIIPNDLAEEFRNNVEQDFGAHAVGNVIVSVSGAIGATFEAADDLLQSRKLKRKLAR